MVQYLLNLFPLAVLSLAQEISMVTKHVVFSLFTPQKETGFHSHYSTYITLLTVRSLENVLYISTANVEKNSNTSIVFLLRLSFNIIFLDFFFFLLLLPIIAATYIDRHGATTRVANWTLEEGMLQDCG